MATLSQGLALIEPVPVDDDLCSRLALIEDLGFAMRFVLAQEQTCYESSGPMLVVKRKIVMPYPAANDGVAMTNGFLDRRGRSPAGPADLLQLVRG